MKIRKRLQTSLEKSPPRGDFSRDVCSRLFIFLETAKRLQTDVKFKKNFKIHMRGEAVSRKVSERLQTSLEKSGIGGDFSRDVCSRLRIFLETAKRLQTDVKF